MSTDCFVCDDDDPGPRPEGCSRLWCKPWFGKDEEEE
ncbi:hypothetical protein SEA_PHINKBODEN_141 [Gordonia Phage PhinkBoden]|nr:hypothetical protein SEA_PHINKBODEN_141 [Gordonia Phage PhinkBoden]